MTCRVLHIALEGGPASFGGLGNVATQMYQAQNNYFKNQQPLFDASIITPLYPKLFKKFNQKILLTEVEHLFNYETVVSKIYLYTDANHTHYLLEPPEHYKHLFEINSLQEIYLDTHNSFFLDRLKFFNSAVAAYLGKGPIGNNHPDPQILQLHDWQAALIPVLLRDKYKNFNIKTAFTVHIDNFDNGGYPCYWLDGIGMDLDSKEEMCSLKAIGLMRSDRIITVSKHLLQECLNGTYDDKLLEFLRKIYILANAQDRAIGITNGINYDKYCPLSKLIKNSDNINVEKQALKQQLAQDLSGSRSNWKFDPNLPLILYVGRFAPEKGVDCFEQLIKAIDGRATFMAIGRSMTDEVYQTLLNHSRQADNVFITFSELEQNQFIERMRAAADFVFIPSRREALGLVALEGMANGAICITTGVGGLRDIVNPLQYKDLDNISGNGIFYEIMPEGEINPALQDAINKAITLWQSLGTQQKNMLQKRIMLEAREFDWCADAGALQQYLDIFNSLLFTKKSSHKYRAR